MKRILLIVLSLALSACTTMKQERVNVDFKAAEYNNLSNSYTNMLTYAIDYPEENVIGIHNEFYGGNSAQSKNILFYRNSTGESIKLIDKFLEWNNLAIERNEKPSKVIGIANQKDGPFYVHDLEFSIHEGSILVIKSLDGNNFYPMTQQYHVSQAKKLKLFLESYQSGSLKKIDYDAYQ